MSRKQQKPADEWVDITNEKRADDGWVDITNEARSKIEQQAQTSPLETPKKGFLQGLIDVPQEIYEDVAARGKLGAEQIRRGEYGPAFHTMTEPLMQGFEGLVKQGVSTITGKPLVEGVETPEKAKKFAVGQVAGAVGYPTKGFQEAWEQEDYPRLGGQALAALATLGIGSKVHGLLNERRAAAPIETPPSTPPPPSAPPSGQLRLPLEGGEAAQLGLPLDRPTGPPARPTIDEIYGLTDKILGIERPPTLESEQGGLDFGPLRNRAGHFTSTPDWQPGPLLNDFSLDPANSPYQVPSGQQHLGLDMSGMREGPPLNETRSGEPIPEPPPPPVEQTNPGDGLPPSAGPVEDIIEKDNYSNGEALELMKRGYEPGASPTTGKLRFVKRLKSETGAMFIGPRDPRITSEVPQYPEPETPPPSGEYGPPSAGAPAPKEPNLPLGTGNVAGGFNDSLSNNPLRTAVESQRAQMEAEVNAELGAEPQKRGGGIEAIKKFMMDEEGSFDPQALIEELRRRFGREPTEEEIQRLAFTKGTGAQPGEERGRVAPFLTPEQRQERLDDIANVPWDERSTTAKQLQDDYNRLIRLAEVYPPGPELEAIKDRLREIENTTDPTTGEPYIDSPYPGRGEEGPQLSNTGNPWMEGEVIGSPKFSANSYLGEAVPGIDRPVRQKKGQLNLPLIGEVPERGGLDVAPLRQYNLFPEAGQPKLPFEGKEGPREFSGPELPPDTADEGGGKPLDQMTPEEKDAEINKYLKEEDATPPEMRDLETGEAPPRKWKWNEELKKFIKNDEGAQELPDIESIIRWINDRFRRARGRNATNEELNEELTHFREQAGGYTYRGMPNLDIPTANEYSLPSTVQGQQDIINAVETGEPLQQQLPQVGQMYSRYLPGDPNPYFNYEPYSSEKAALGRLQQTAKQIAQLMEEAKAASDAGDTFTERSKRVEIAALRKQPDYWLGRAVNKSEELMARADRAKDPAVAEKLRKLADQALEEELGQQKFEWRQRRLNPEELGMTQEMVDRIKSGLNPNEFAASLGRSFAHSTLSGIPDGPPGLTVREYHNGSATIYYRNPQGKTIGYASIYGDNGRTGTLAVDEKSGLLQGRAIVSMLKEIFKRGAVLPDSSYSPFTKNALETLVRLWDESHGSFDITPILRALDTGGTYINKSIDKMKQKLGITPQQQGQQVEYNFIREALEFPSAAVTTLDMSYPGRQGLNQILTPQFWYAAYKMFGGITPKGFAQIDADIRSKPIYQQGPINPRTGKPEPSFAEKIGAKLFEPASATNIVGQRAQGVASRWIETGGFLGGEKIFGRTNPLAAAWKHTIGYPIRATNRMWITMANVLNSNRLEFLLDRAADASGKALTTGSTPLQGVMGGFNPSTVTSLGPIPIPDAIRNRMPDIDIGLSKQVTSNEAREMNPYLNLDLAKEIAEFVNTATGHATARNMLERAVSRVGPILFSPGFTNSRIRLLNPGTYVTASPFVRKQYLKTALGAFAGWAAFTQLSKVAAKAQNLDYEIVTDPTNADFGKFRIGNTRLDFGQGFLQFAVLLSRMYKGGWTSSSNPEEGFHTFGEDFPPETQWTNAERFVSNRLNPAVKFAYDLANASKQQPFAVGDRTLQLFVNLFAQDITELAKENPKLLPWLAPVALGAGTQTYGKMRDSQNKPGSKFIKPENDIVLENFPLKNFWPGNWGGSGSSDLGY